jgi:Skp family chaperone for outer membrane proteins
MRMTSRAAWALGLGVLGMAGLVGTTLAQQDGGVQRTNSQGSAAKALTPAIIGSVDIEAVIKQYEKYKFTGDQLKNDAMAKQGQLQQIAANMKTIAKKLEALTPGSPEFKKEESEYTKSKVQLESERESAQHDFAQREAESLATIYKEVQSMVGRVARNRGMTYVVRTSNEPITGTEPNSVIAAMQRSVVYADPGADITKVVLYNLNLEYSKAASANAPARSATAPTGKAAK